MNESHEVPPLSKSRMTFGPGVVFELLASPRLAMALLAIILTSCLLGVTIFRDEQAWEYIFSALWFNALLVLLVVNVGFCFFGRIWGRKVTLVSFGMILFHLSFITIFIGIVYNSMFYFRGMLRLTEGETLPNNDLRSFDNAEGGRFFDINTFKGETTLIKMHTGYKIDGADKRAAYEIAVGEGLHKKQGVLYVTRKFVYNEFQFFNDREGYSLLVTLHDGRGRELYGAHIPLQSLKQKDGSYLYTTGPQSSPGGFAYPQGPLKPLFALQVSYKPLPQKERSGSVGIETWRLSREAPGPGEKPFARGTVSIGKKFKVDNDHYLMVNEVRYWAMMSVRHEPGKPIVLTSLWAGLGGMIITFLGRIRKASSESKLRLGGAL